MVDVTGECDTPAALIANIPDGQLSGSGYFDSRYHYGRSRLYTQGNGGSIGGAWITDGNTVGEYIQADFGQLQRIQAVATQGRHDWDQWVTSYKFAYSTDGVTYDYVRNDDGSKRVFGGNSDRDTVIEHSFDVPIVARFVRLCPQTYHDSMSLRWEIYDCIYNG